MLGHMRHTYKSHVRTHVLLLQCWGGGGKGAGVICPQGFLQYAHRHIMVIAAMFVFFLADRGAKYFYSLVKSLSRLLSSFCHLKGYSDLTYGHKRSLVSPNINVLQVILRITRRTWSPFSRTDHLTQEVSF